MSVQSWQVACPRCGWANSGANPRCGKCGWPLRQATGLLKAGEKYEAPGTGSRARPVKVLQPGGFLPRLIALVLDTLILLAIVIPVTLLWRAQMGEQLSHSAITSDLVLEQLKQDAILLAGVGLVSLFYYVGSWNILGASPGMLIMNLRVVDKTGQSPNFGRAFLRYFVLNLLYATVIGAVISAFRVAVSKEKRGLHDMMAGTYVLHMLDPDRVLAEAQRDAQRAAAPVPAPAAPMLPVTPPPPPPAQETYQSLAGAAGTIGMASATPPINLLSASLGPAMAPAPSATAAAPPGPQPSPPPAAAPDPRVDYSPPPFQALTPAAAPPAMQVQPMPAPLEVPAPPPPPAPEPPPPAEAELLASPGLPQYTPPSADPDQTLVRPPAPPPASPAIDAIPEIPLVSPLEAAAFVIPSIPPPAQDDAPPPTPPAPTTQPAAGADLPMALPWEALPLPPTDHPPEKKRRGGKA